MQELYTQYRWLLFKLAYQLTGSVSDAEDVVQDVFLKAYSVPPERLVDPKAYLCKMVANRCKDLHKAARKQREQYFGDWLPEPYVRPEGDSMDEVVRDDLLSYAMLVLLERLTPAERTVFVLREALAFDYREIAELMEKSEVNCRKIFSRASAKMGLDPDEPIHAAEPTSRSWVDGFMSALKQGNMDRILSLLDQEVVMVSDGGGKVHAAINPIVTPQRVARFLLGPIRQFLLAEDALVEVGRNNGQYGIVLRSDEGVHTVGMVHVEQGRIRNMYVIRNPDKLKHIDV